MLKSLYIDIRNRLRELIAGTEFDGKVFFVGGCCRDDIMGTEIKDIDISVALPDGGIRLAMWLHENGHLAGEVSAFPEFHTAKFPFLMSSWSLSIPARNHILTAAAGTP